ncbi:MAG TPA: cytochrome c3 family protein [Kofleriaceae bacterium]|nr:cytochrome c3 family protein [Kofleriaceae bacterium]
MSRTLLSRGALLVASLILATSVAVAGFSRGDFGGEPVSPVIFPAQELPLKFDHAQHLAMNIECDFCHEDAPESRSSLDNLIPTEEVCASCHPIDRDEPEKHTEPGKPPARCDACHVGYDPATGMVARIKIPPPNLKFDHRAHVSKGVACTTCHGDLQAEGVQLATREHLPKMRLCLQCHDGRQARQQCSTCHLSTGGVIQTSFPEGQLTPSGALRGARHDLNFRTSHRAAAESDPAYCASCHKKDFCVECHNGVTKPMDFHVGDYVTLHTIDARRNTPDCSSCHRLQTFCVGCHTRSGVTPDARTSEFLGVTSGDSTRRFHPPGWISLERGQPKTGDGARGVMHHSFQAQRNVRQCASCHREDFCTTCHSAQRAFHISADRAPFTVNPHPNGWRNSAKCRALAAKAGRMCLRCHTEVSEAHCDHMTPMP